MSNLNDNGKLRMIAPQSKQIQSKTNEVSDLDKIHDPDYENLGSSVQTLKNSSISQGLSNHGDGYVTIRKGAWTRILEQVKLLDDNDHVFGK